MYVQLSIWLSTHIHLIYGMKCVRRYSPHSQTWTTRIQGLSELVHIIQCSSQEFLSEREGGFDNDRQYMYIYTSTTVILIPMKSL